MKMVSDEIGSTNMEERQDRSILKVDHLFYDVGESSRFSISHHVQFFK
jgi:hypothetical protein